MFLVPYRIPNRFFFAPSDFQDPLITDDFGKARPRKRAHATAICERRFAADGCGDDPSCPARSRNDASPTGSPPPPVRRLKNRRCPW
jgi:hypothetical protein